MLGQKEAHPQIRQEDAVWNLDLVWSPAVIIDSDYHRPSSCNYQSIIDPPPQLVVQLGQDGDPQTGACQLPCIMGHGCQC